MSEFLRTPLRRLVDLSPAPEAAPFQPRTHTGPVVAKAQCDVGAKTSGLGRKGGNPKRGQRAPSTALNRASPLKPESRDHWGPEAPDILKQQGAMDLTTPRDRKKKNPPTPTAENPNAKNPPSKPKQTSTKTRSDRSLSRGPRMDWRRRGGGRFFSFFFFSGG